MKVEIQGRAISCAYYMNEAKLPRLVINTKDKWVDYTTLSSCVGSICLNYKHNSSVVITAETDEDFEVLDCLRFENTCKDQKIILFVKDCLLS